MGDKTLSALCKEGELWLFEQSLLFSMVNCSLENFLRDELSLFMLRLKSLVILDVCGRSQYVE